MSTIKRKIISVGSPSSGSGKNNKERDYNINVWSNEFKENRKTLVFMHGYLGRIDDFRPIMEEFKSSLNVIGIDLRGHGGSDSPENLPWLISDFASDIYQVLDAMIPVNHEVILVASSMGSAISLELAKSYPGLVSKLLLLSATRKFKVPGWIKLMMGLSNFSFRATSTIMNSLTSMFSQFSDPEERELYQQGVQRFKDLGFEIHKRIFEDVFLKWQADVEKLTQPVLVVSGLEDKIIPPEEGKKLVEELSMASRVTLENVDHHILLRRRATVINLIHLWMEHEDYILSKQDWEYDGLIERIPACIYETKEKGSIDDEITSFS